MILIRAGTRVGQWQMHTSVLATPEDVPGGRRRTSTSPANSRSVLIRYSQCMKVGELTTWLLRLARGAEVLAFEPGCEEYREREVDEVEWLGHRVYLHSASAVTIPVDETAPRSMP